MCRYMYICLQIADSRFFLMLDVRMPVLYAEPLARAVLIQQVHRIKV